MKLEKHFYVYATSEEPHPAVVSTMLTKFKHNNIGDHVTIKLKCKLFFSDSRRLKKMLSCWGVGTDQHTVLTDQWLVWKAKLTETAEKDKQHISSLLSTFRKLYAFQTSKYLLCAIWQHKISITDHSSHSFFGLWGNHWMMNASKYYL